MRFIGCKSLLLGSIEDVVYRHANNATTFCDVFSGTATVARHFKDKFTIISNDALYFSYCLQRATIENDFIPQFTLLRSLLGGISPIRYLNELSTTDMETLPKQYRFFQNNYSPIGNRMYLTDDNALRIDYSRNIVEEWHMKGLLSDNEYYYLIACIVEGIPFVSNIKGTYGAYSKTWDSRSRKRFELYSLTVKSNGRDNKSYNEDGVTLLKRLTGDILYIDPPYNERQYLPNYHVLETAARYDSPVLHGVTGQRDYAPEQKSAFCSKNKAEKALSDLLSIAQFRHIIMSYSTDGIISTDRLISIFKEHGIASTFEIISVPYRRFKSRNTTTNVQLSEFLLYIRKEI